MKEYTVALEISGPTAMWTRPDTGSTPVVCPLSPYSTIEGVNEV